MNEDYTVLEVRGCSVEGSTSPTAAELVGVTRPSRAALLISPPVRTGPAALVVEATPTELLDGFAVHDFYLRAMRLVAEEYDGRQAVVLQELMSFTEISSTFGASLLSMLKPFRP